MAELHPELEPLRVLLGSWEGRGEGHYPTIDDFAYLERVTFGHVGKPYLDYEQRTRHPQQGHPMHAEVGYLRLVEPDRVEVVLVHPTGIVEVQEGSWDGARLQLASTTVGTTSTARPVRSLRREFRVEGDVLSYDLWMAHGEVPESHHLSARLRRVRDSEEHD